MLEAGNLAPAVALRAGDGSIVSLADLLKNGPAALVFFKISCPVCQLALPFVDRLTAGSNSALRIYGVSQDDQPDTDRFATRFASNTTMLLDEEDSGYAVSNAFGITHVPSVFVVEPDGIISHSWTGFSKQDFEKLGGRVGFSPFRPGENVPAWKAG